MVYLFIALTAVLILGSTVNTCPAGTGAIFEFILVRQLFTTDFASDGQIVKLNFSSQNFVPTDWSFLTEPRFLFNVVSHQVEDNIIVITYEDFGQNPKNPNRFLIHYQESNKTFNLEDPLNGYPFLGAVFSVRNTLFHCAVNISMKNPTKTPCISLKKADGTFQHEPLMSLKYIHRDPAVVIVNDEPCLFGGGVDEPSPTECLNTRTMQWYRNDNLPVVTKASQKGIVHNKVLYICGYTYEECDRYALYENGFKKVLSTPFPRFGIAKTFDLVIEDDKVVGVGVIFNDQADAVKVEVDNMDNKIVIPGPFGVGAFVSVCG